MRIIISLSGDIYFRGITQKFSKEVQDKSHITWVTRDVDYASKYADTKGVLLTYDLSLKRGFNFGFRTLDTSVQFDEIKSRVKRGIMEAFKSNSLSLKLGLALNDELDSLEFAGYKKVWEWYSTVPRLAIILKSCGYSHINAREGINNDIVTVGILDKSCILDIKERANETVLL